MGEFKAEMGGVKERLGAVEAGVGELKTEMGGVKAEVGGVKERLGAVEAGMGEFKAEMDGAKERLGGVETEIGGVKAELGALREQVQTSDERINRRIDRLEDSHREEHRAVTAEVQRLTVDVAGLNALAERNVVRTVSELLAAWATREVDPTLGDQSRMDRVFAETPPEGEDQQR